MKKRLKASKRRGRIKRERDPHGKSAHSKGSKLDSGKNRVALVIGGFANALWGVSEVGTFGAQKYVPDGWEDVPDGINRYTDAMCRHLMKEAMGELVDSDSQLLHAKHLAWNALARLEMMMRGGGRWRQTKKHSTKTG